MGMRIRSSCVYVSMSDRVFVSCIIVLHQCLTAATDVVTTVIDELGHPSQSVFLSPPFKTCVLTVMKGTTFAMVLKLRASL